MKIDKEQIGEISMNELSHYESLKKQDLEHRRLIKKLQVEIKSLKQGQSLPIDIVSNCDHKGISKDIFEVPKGRCKKCNIVF